MHSTKVAVCFCALVFGAAAAQGDPIIHDLMPLTPVADESVFGDPGNPDLSQSSPYVGGGFAGTLDSRVYFEDANPITWVTFVFDLQVTLAAADVSEMKLVKTGIQKDLRIGEIAAGTNGYVESPATTNIPDTAVAIDNGFPTADELIYDWLIGNEIPTGGRATLYITTTGAVDVGLVTAYIQDGGQAEAVALAPVDDPDSPDIGIPEPVSLMLFTAAACLALRRRRR